MNAEQALHQFWSSFGWLAIDENSAYDEDVLIRLGGAGQAERTLSMPKNYITYEMNTGYHGATLPLSASLYSRSTSWEEVTVKSKEIASAIGYGGKMIQVDGGYIWIKLGSPFSKRLDSGDTSIRRLYLSIMVSFFVMN